MTHETPKISAVFPSLMGTFVAVDLKKVNKIFNQ